MIFSHTPTFIICFIGINPLEKSMAFGGVEIGSIKAKLEAMVTGITNIKTDSPTPSAIPITTGINIVTKATLLITSVRNRVTKINAKTRKTTDRVRFSLT